MSSCVRCGHELDVGRFCTNCGHRVDAPAPTEAFPGLPTTPAASSVPPRARYPLYADEVGAPPSPEPPPPAPVGVAPTPHRRRPWGTRIAVSVVLLVVVGLGAWLLSDRDDETAMPDRQGQRPAPADVTTSAPSTPVSPPTSAGQTGDLAALSTVEVPATAPANQDVEGNPVEFVATNLLDGVPETCWRMPGDGSGEEITITLPGEASLRSVGLINGYAKTAQDAQGRELDWYHGNRRVLSVEWVFDDGTTVGQDLADTTAVQSVDLDGVTTSTITLRLVTVSEPGPGRASRDYTAISEVSVVGSVG